MKTIKVDMMYDKMMISRLFHIVESVMKDFLNKKIVLSETNCYGQLCYTENKDGYDIQITKYNEDTTVITISYRQNTYVHSVSAYIMGQIVSYSYMKECKTTGTKCYTELTKNGKIIHENIFE